MVFLLLVTLKTLKILSLLLEQIILGLFVFLLHNSNESLIRWPYFSYTHTRIKYSVDSILERYIIDFCLFLEFHYPYKIFWQSLFRWINISY